MQNSSLFCPGLTGAIQTNLGISDRSVFVWFKHDNKERDGTDLTLKFVTRVEEPIQGELPSRTSLTSLKIEVS